MSGEIKRGKQHEQDQAEPAPVLWVIDETEKLIQALPDYGKTVGLNQIIRDLMAAGRSERIDLKDEYEYTTSRQWAHHGGRDDYGRAPYTRQGKSSFRLPAPEFPVRVGDVVRVIDTMQGERAVPGHVVDIDGWWVYVSGPLGRKVPFYGQTGFQVGDYRWRLEPYITEEESNR
jgi:hypothetical protein